MAHTTKQLNTFHLFAGAGGGILGDLLLGHNPIGACEIEQYPRDVLLARQRDGILPNFPIWDDVATLDGNPWRGSVDVLCGGFPCQDISAAGKGAGISGERSGLWKEYARLIGEMRPRFVFAENSPLLRTRGLGVVLEDLAALGYNARWGIIGAGAVGAPHKRDRMWVLAYPTGAGLEGHDGNYSTESDQEPWASNSRSESGNGFWHTDPAEVSHSDLHEWSNDCRNELGDKELSVTGKPRKVHQPIAPGTQAQEIPIEPCVGRVAHGVANRVHRLKAIGNGQVPQCAAVAFNILSEGLTNA
jgi:DNA (cytosine-5)-methyltransferase 1